MDMEVVGVVGGGEGLGGGGGGGVVGGSATNYYLAYRHPQADGTFVQHRHYLFYKALLRQYQIGSTEYNVILQSIQTIIDDCPAAKESIIITSVFGNGVFERRGILAPGNAPFEVTEPPHPSNPLLRTAIFYAKLVALLSVYENHNFLFNDEPWTVSNVYNWLCQVEIGRREQIENELMRIMETVTSAARAAAIQHYLHGPSGVSGSGTDTTAHAAMYIGQGNSVLYVIPNQFIGDKEDLLKYCVSHSLLHEGVADDFELKAFPSHLRQYKGYNLLTVSLVVVDSSNRHITLLASGAVNQARAAGFVGGAFRVNSTAAAIGSMSVLLGITELTRRWAEIMFGNVSGVQFRSTIQPFSSRENQYLIWDSVIFWDFWWGPVCLVRCFTAVNTRGALYMYRRMARVQIGAAEFYSNLGTVSRGVLEVFITGCPICNDGSTNHISAQWRNRTPADFVILVLLREKCSNSACRGFNIRKIATDLTSNDINEAKLMFIKFEIKSKRDVRGWKIVGIAPNELLQRV